MSKGDKTIILGITHPISWNNGACILVDGQLVAMIEEERLNRYKHSPRVRPVRSIQYCLDAAGCRIEDVDFIAVGWDHEVTRSPLGIGSRQYHVLSHLMSELPFRRKDRRIRWVNHHVAHALSSYYASGFEKANVISLDAWGGQESGILGYGEGDDFEVLHRISRDSSWGNVYGAITGRLGFLPHSEEGKVMGLAAYGTPDPDLYN